MSFWNFRSYKVPFWCPPMWSVAGSRLAARPKRIFALMRLLGIWKSFTLMISLLPRTASARKMKYLCPRCCRSQCWELGKIATGLSLDPLRDNAGMDQMRIHCSVLDCPCDDLKQSSSTRVWCQPWIFDAEIFTGNRVHQENRNQIRLSRRAWHGNNWKYSGLRLWFIFFWLYKFSSAFPFWQELRHWLFAGERPSSQC